MRGAPRNRFLPGALLVMVCGEPRALATPEPDAPRAVVPGTIIDALSDEGQPQRFRIDSVDSDPRDLDGDVRLYGVSIFNPSSKTWEAYCRPDVEGRSAAIPVQGSWSAKGELEPASGLITFACTGGAIGKCIRFGYKPWKTLKGIPLAPYHAACVRMVRADYCGDGKSHTLDGTWIDVWDGIGIQKRDEPDQRPEVFEAAWSPAGASYLNVPRWSDDVAGVVKDCPKHFAGRTSNDLQLVPSKVQKHFPEVLIFNARFIRSEDRRVRQ